MSEKVVIQGPGPLAGTISIPGDKSITHRALIFSAIAEGESRLLNILPSEDCLSTLRILQNLGVEIERAGDETRLLGRGFYGLDEPKDVLDVGNSGTALRVLPAVLAAQAGVAVITGDSSIRKRPVDRIIEPIASMGGKLWAREGGRLPPLTIVGGQLKGTEYRLPVASAQVKTAVILAGILAEGESTVIEPVRSRDHTEIMLNYLGAAISIEEQAEGRRIIVQGRQQFSGREIVVPGDFSSAAFFLAAGALSGASEITVQNSGLNPTRTGFIEVLERMGAGVKIADQAEFGGERSGSVTALKSTLRSLEIGGDIIPRIIDELPLVALLATQADGQTVVKDAAELRVKETDRISLVARELKKMGARITGTPDGFLIDGPTPLFGADVDSHGDHRLAMMLAVATTVATGETTINNADAVDVSFPGFFKCLQSLGAELVSIAG